MQSVTMICRDERIRNKGKLKKSGMVESYHQGIQ